MDHRSIGTGDREINRVDFVWFEGLLSKETECNFTTTGRIISEQEKELISNEPYLFTDSTQGRQRLHILKKLKSFEGPVLKCRVSRKDRGFYLNELVIHEIRKNAPAIFQNFLFICCNI